MIFLIGYFMCNAVLTVYLIREALREPFITGADILVILFSIIFAVCLFLVMYFATKER